MNRLTQLAINAEGFVFDPTSGESFTVNPTGAAVLKGLQADKPTEVIAQELADEYNVSATEVEKDIMDFKSHLRSYKLAS
jgi:hypothetical protein